MARIDDLLNDLTQTLNSLEKILGSNGRLICQKELAEVTAALAKVSHSTTKKSLHHFIMTTKNIIVRIESEVFALENEMHGVEGYSDYEYERMKNCERKIILKNELERMLKTIQEYETDSRHLA